MTKDQLALELTEFVLHVKESLWIETADIKDMYVT